MPTRWELAQILRRGLRDPAFVPRLLSDERGRVGVVPPRAAALAGTMGWIRRSFEATGDGGSSAGYEMGRGWATSYPETTGYLIPTLQAYAAHSGERSWNALAHRATGWLLSIQEPCGGWQALQVAQKAPPRVFNTAMVLEGLVASGDAEPDPRVDEAVRRGVHWILERVSDSGRIEQDNFSGGGSFDALVAACALEAARKIGELEQVRPRLSRVLEAILAWQTNTGWFHHCNIAERYAQNRTALLHHVGYTLEGLLRASEVLGESNFASAAARGARGVLAAFEERRVLPSECVDGWRPHHDRGRGFSECLTGYSQLAGVWLRLFEKTQDAAFLRGARSAIDRVSAIANREAGHPGLAHGVPGSFPLSAWYQRFQLVNWAAKYHVDSMLREAVLVRASAAAAAARGPRT